MPINTQIKQEHNMVVKSVNMEIKPVSTMDIKNSIITTTTTNSYKEPKPQLDKQAILHTPASKVINKMVTTINEITKTKTINREVIFNSKAPINNQIRQANKDRLSINNTDTKTINKIEDLANTKITTKGKHTRVKGTTIKANKEKTLSSIQSTTTDKITTTIRPKTFKDNNIRLKLKLLNNKFPKSSKS